MNEALRKAVERMCSPLHESVLSGATAQEDARCMALIAQALRDQEAEIATHRANYDALVIRLGEVTERLEAADGLLRECLSAIDLHPVARASITTHLKAADHV